MKLIVAKNIGFCVGVKNAVDKAFSYASKDGVYTLGELIHNPIINDKLKQSGILSADSIDKVPDGSTLIIRSHGAKKSDYQYAKDHNITVVDCTCQYVSYVRQKAEDYYKKGYQVVLLGQKQHAEIIGINSFCDNNAIIIDDGQKMVDLSGFPKVCVLCQTTFDINKFDHIANNINNENEKVVEIFKTICYTTNIRQKEAAKIAKQCDAVLVLGGAKSSNTDKLSQTCKMFCQRVYKIENTKDPIIPQLPKYKTVGIVAGASTPIELIEEVIDLMSNKVEAEKDSVVHQNDEFTKAIEKLESKKQTKFYKGRRLIVTVVAVNDEGLMVNIGSKREAIIPNEEITIEESFEEAKAKYNVGDSIEVVVVSSDKTPYILSRKEIEEASHKDKIVDSIRNGEEFSLVFNESNSGGLISKLGSYTVFVPKAQIKTNYVHNLEPFIGKTLRLSAIKIDDKRKSITASQKIILEKERQEKEDAFWAGIQVGETISGKVVRFNDFGAFVNVNGFDCLAHITDLSWGSIKSPAEVLEINKTYEFKILKADREKNRVSLGYKQLHPHPWQKVSETYPVGSVVTGKVVRILPFGAFVEIEPGLDGLVHISNISHDWISTIVDAVKIGDVVTARVNEIDIPTRKLTLSIKATLPEPVKEVQPKKETVEKPKTVKKPKKVDEDGEAKPAPVAKRAEPRAEKSESTHDRPRRPRDKDDDGPREYISDSGSSSIGDILAGLKLDMENE